MVWPRGPRPERLAAIGTALFLAFTSMSTLGAPAASASTEDTLYAGRYL